MIKLLVLATTLFSAKANDDLMYIAYGHSHHPNMHDESYFYIFPAKGGFKMLIAVGKVDTGENYNPSLLYLKHILKQSDCSFTPNKTYYLMEPRLPNVDPKDFFEKVSACKKEQNQAAKPYYATLTNSQIMESKELKKMYTATLLQHLGKDLIDSIKALDNPQQKTLAVIVQKETKAPASKKQNPRTEKK